MKIDVLIENWRKFLKEEKSLIDAIAKKSPEGKYFISINTLNKIFKYFHISRAKLGDDAFTFTPRVPNEPYVGDNGYTIEDDFTNRISVGPSIEKCLQALEIEPEYTSKYPRHLYAIDFVDIQDDDIPAFNLKTKFPKCPASPENKYGIEFDMLGWMNYHDFDDTTIKNPANLPAKWRNQFLGCVPDAIKTDEKWLLQPTKMYYLGVLKGKFVFLEETAVVLLERYLQKLNQEDEVENG